MLRDNHDQRVSFQGDVRVTYVDERSGRSQMLTLRARDLSRSAMFVIAESPLKPEQAVAINFQLPCGYRISTAARVVRTIASEEPFGPSGMALAFDTLDPQSDERISETVASLYKTKGPIENASSPPLDPLHTDEFAAYVDTEDARRKA